MMTELTPEMEVPENPLPQEPMKEIPENPLLGEAGNVAGTREGMPSGLSRLPWLGP